MSEGEYRICYNGWKVHTLTNKVILNEITVSLSYNFVSNTLNLIIHIVSDGRSEITMKS